MAVMASAAALKPALVRVVDLLQLHPQWIHAEI
jgi:hypothetical protein